MAFRGALYFSALLAVALLSAALVLLMHLGFASLESGLCQRKNTVNILFKKQIESAPDPAAESRKLAQEYREKFNNPYHAAGTGYVDDIIEPRETRSKLIASLAALRDKFSAAPPRKHGNIPV